MKKVFGNSSMSLVTEVLDKELMLNCKEVFQPRCDVFFLESVLGNY